ncbi:MAG: hypothetical protein WAV60_05070, partial [Anaerolineae bacterium]
MVNRLAVGVGVGEGTAGRVGAGVLVAGLVALDVGVSVGSKGMMGVAPRAAGAGGGSSGSS